MAVKIGLATFIVPFMFFVSPLLLGQGDLPAVIGVTATASLGVVMLACSTEGWLAGKLRLLPRVMLFAGSLCLIVPEPVTDGLGLGLGAGALLLDWAGRRRRSRS